MRILTSMASFVLLVSLAACGGDDTAPGDSGGGDATVDTGGGGDATVDSGGGDATADSGGGDAATDSGGGDASADAAADGGGDGGGDASIPPGMCSDDPTACTETCLRPYSCVTVCGGPATKCGCCPCAEGSIDDITCP